MSSRHHHLRHGDRTGPAGPLRAVVATVTVLAVLALAAFPARDVLYTAVAGSTEASALGTTAGLVAEDGLYVLLAAAGVLAVLAWLRDRRAFWVLVAGGAGTVVAYAVSETVKLLVTEERPCRALTVETVLACPPAGDWSWPSNHSVLAAACATACVLAVPRSGWFVVPVAALVAGSRVAAGVHYVHDVLAGAALGVLVVAVVVALARPLVGRLAPAG